MINDISFRSETLRLLQDKCLCMFHESINVCGIYAIFNKVNGKVYIGKTTRKIHQYIRNERLYKLREGRMHNKQLQQEFIKYGESSFEFFIIEKFLRNDKSEELVKTINYLEVYYIDKFNTTDKNHGYNKEIGGEDDITIEEIRELIKVEDKKRLSWAYGDFSDSKSLPFSVPADLVPKSKVKCSSIGLGSVIERFVKEDQGESSFDEYLKRFLYKYRERNYVKEYSDLIPQLLVQKILQKFPNTPIKSR